MFQKPLRNLNILIYASYKTIKLERVYQRRSFYKVKDLNKEDVPHNYVE